MRAHLVCRHRKIWIASGTCKEVVNFSNLMTINLTNRFYCFRPVPSCARPRRPEQSEPSSLLLGRHGRGASNQFLQFQFDEMKAVDWCVTGGGGGDRCGQLRPTDCAGCYLPLPRTESGLPRPAVPTDPAHLSSTTHSNRSPTSSSSRVFTRFSIGSHPTSTSSMLYRIR